jgi:Skp family chaperone for outer membrane proteins
VAGPYGFRLSFLNMLRKDNTMVRLFFMSLAFVMVLGLGASAQELKSVAVVDLKVILQSSKAGASIKQQMNKKQEEYKKDLESQQKKLSDAKDALARDRSVLSPDTYAEKRKAFENDLGKLQTNMRGKKNSLDKAFSTAMETLQTQTMAVVSDLAKEKNYTLVLPRSSVLVMTDSSMDITQDVLSALDEKLTKVDLKF